MSSDRALDTFWQDARLSIPPKSEAGLSNARGAVHVVLHLQIKGVKRQAEACSNDCLEPRNIMYLILQEQKHQLPAARSKEDILTGMKLFLKVIQQDICFLRRIR